MGMGWDAIMLYEVVRESSKVSVYRKSAVSITYKNQPLREYGVYGFNKLCSRPFYGRGSAL